MAIVASIYLRFYIEVRVGTFLLSLRLHGPGASSFFYHRVKKVYASLISYVTIEVSDPDDDGDFDDF
jgi:hypothetical protein